MLIFFQFLFALKLGIAKNCVLYILAKILFLIE